MHTMTNRSRTIRCVLSLVLAIPALIILPGCGGDEESLLAPAATLPVPPTSPENLIAALEALYNDGGRSAAERSELLAELVPSPWHASLPLFAFHFAPDVAPAETVPIWGVTEERLAHEALFRAQEQRDIGTLRLEIEARPPVALPDPDAGQEEWQVVHAERVELRVTTSPDDVVLYEFPATRFITAPADDRWYIVEWRELSRPSKAEGAPLTDGVTIASWGDLKLRHAAEADLELVPALDAPERLLRAIEIIYNDRKRANPERQRLYELLFPPTEHATLTPFLFRFQSGDVPPGGEPSWGRTEELRSHRNIFRDQFRHHIMSVELEIAHGPPTELEFPSPGQEDWRQIFADRVDLAVMHNPCDGYAVSGGQARFVLSPAEGRWFISEWVDLPRPVARAGIGADAGDEPLAVEPMTWGAIKLSYRDR